MKKREKIVNQLFIGKVSEIIGFDKTTDLLKEASNAFFKCKRPKKKSKALKLINKGKEIEIENQFVYDFLNYIDYQKPTPFKIICSENKYNEGWTAISNYYR